jgi:hypothetical protein
VVATHTFDIRIDVLAEISAPPEHRPDGDGHYADIHDDAGRGKRHEMEVVVPHELAGMIVLEKVRQVSRNCDGEDEGNCNPKWTVEVWVDSLKSQATEKSTSARRQ